MKKIINVFLLIFIFCIVFACITVNAEDIYNGTYKFTNTSNTTVKLYFTNSGTSDVVFYNAQNEVIDIIPYEKNPVSANLAAGVYCLINNLNTGITLPEGVTAETSGKTSLIERHTILADSAKTYTFRNTSAYAVKMSAYSSTTGSTVTYDANGSVSGYDNSFRFKDKYNNELKAFEARTVNGIDAEIYYPTDSGIVFTETESDSVFKKYDILPDKIYRIKNNSDKTISFRVTKSIAPQKVVFDSTGAVTGYSYAENINSSNYKDITSGTSYDIKNNSDTMTLYFPLEFDISVEESSKDKLFEEYTMSPDKIYKITNHSDMIQSYRTKNSDSGRKIVYKSDGAIKGYGISDNINSAHATDLKAGESTEFEDYSLEVYIPVEFNITFEESTKDKLFNEYTMSSDKIYKITNHSDMVQSYRTKNSDSGRKIVYNSDGTIKDYYISDNINSTHATDLKAGESTEFEDYSLEVYIPVEFNITFEESPKTELFKKYIFDKSHSYEIKSSSSRGYDLLFPQAFTADIVIYQDGKLTDFAYAQNIYRYYTIASNRTYLFSECDAEVYCLADLINSGLFTITEQEFSDNVMEYEVTADRVYEIKNSSDTEITLKTIGLSTMARIIYNGNGEIETYSLSKNSNHREFSLKAGYKHLIENASGTIFIPKDYADAVSITQKSAKVFTQIAIPADEAIKIDNSSTQGISVLVNNQSYSLITFASEYQKKYIPSQNRDFEIYKNKYVMLKNICGDVLTLYIPTELANRYITYNNITAQNFDDETKGYYASVEIKKTLSVPQGGEKQTETDFLSSYSIKAYNNTQSKYISLQKNLEGVYLNSADVAVGDSITFTLTSKNTKECNVTAVLNDNCHADLAFEVTELPGIKVYHGQNLTDSLYMLLLYDANGNLVRKDRLYSGLFPHIQEGNYTAVIMNKQGNYPYLPRLDDYEASALAEGIHYVKADVKLTAGIMKELHFADIPNVSDRDLTYFAEGWPVFEVYHTSSQSNDIAKFSFAYETKPGIAEILNRVSVSFHMEEDMIIYPDSIRVNGNTTTYSEYNRTWTINAPADKGTIEFYVKFLRNGSYSFSPTVNFRGANTDKTEKIATLDFANQLVTIYAQSTASTSTLRVAGTSVAEETVGIYCEGVLLGETVAEKNGAYDLQIKLPDAYTGKVYTLYAMCNNVPSQEITVTYVPTKPSIKTLNLKVYTSGQPTTIDLLSESVYSYTFPFSWAFCYEAEFEGIPVDDAYILNNNGKYLKMFYDSSTNKFTTSPKDKAEFVMADTVSYIYQNPAETFKTTIREDRDDNLPPVLKYNKKTVTDMPLESIPQDLMAAYDGLATPEHYLRLTMDALPEAGENLQLAFDVVLFKDTAPVGKTRYNKKNNAYIGPSGAISMTPFLKTMLGADFFSSKNTNIKSNQMKIHYNFNYAPAIGVYSGGGDFPVGQPIANMNNDSRYQQMMENMGFVNDNYGGNPLPDEELGKFKEAVAGMGGDAAVLGFGAYGAFDGYNGVKDLSDRVMNLLNSVCDAGDQEKSIYQMFDEAFLVPKFFTFDPSGYVYEGYEENRLQGVTVTAYYDDNGEKVQWKAEEAGQKNPLKTDEYGAYAWDVPEGTWSVKYEKSGYETVWREEMIVPPPHTNVNVGLVSNSGSKIESIKTSDGKIYVTFTKPVMAEDINKENISFTKDGEDCISEIFPETEHQSEFGILTKTVVINSSNLISGGIYNLIISDAVRTYNGISARDSRGYTHKPIKLTVKANEINLNKGNSVSVDIILEGEDVSNSQISATDKDGQIAEYYISPSQEPGKYTLTIKGNSVGASVVTVGVEGTTVEKSIAVNVYPENYDFTVDRKMIYNSYDKILTIFSPTILGESTVLCCEYDQYSRFKGVKILKNIQLNSTENTIDMSESVRGNEYKIKFMVIRSMNDFQPLIEALEY